MKIGRMAWRNIWRNRRRTIVTVAAMTLALLVMILYSGLLAGYMRDMERNILDLEFGDIQIFAEDYRDKPSLHTTIKNVDGLLAELDKLGYGASPRLMGGGLAAVGEGSAGVMLKGVNVERDVRVSQISHHLSQGQWLDPADPKGVVIGGRLARTLDARVGDELVVLSQATDGSIAADLFIIRGILLGIADSTDRTGVFLNQAAFREFYMLPQGAHQIIVRLPEEVELETGAAAVRRIAAGLDVQTWRQLMPTIASMIDSTRGIMLAIFTIVYLVIAILILNVMLMSVFERIREFGVLKALGVDPKSVFLLIVLESAMQTGLAVLIGLVLSVPGFLYLTKVGIDTGVLGGMNIAGLAFSSIWRAQVSVGAFVGPVLVLVIIVLLAIIYPAIKAARIEPVEAMSHR